MGYMVFDRALAKYTTEPMRGNIERLVEFDAYHCLLSGSLTVSIRAQNTFHWLPTQYLDWLRVCDGGLLFDTVLLSSKKYGDMFGFDFESYEDLNSDTVLSELGVPEGYIVFAVRSYGDPICFDVRKHDEKVYLWDVEKEAFTDIWESFIDWITEEIDDAVDLIAEEALLPLALKIGGGDDEER